MDNYVSCTRENISAKIDWICDPVNREKVDLIRANGNKLISEKHTATNRYIFLKKIMNEGLDINNKKLYINPKYGTEYYLGF